MKKSLCLLLTAFMAIGLAACGAPTATTTQSVVATAVPTVVTFADPELEAMLRGAMGKPVGDITPAEAQAVTTMNLNNKLQRYMTAAAVINDVSGLEGFTNLESLDLSDQAITDISPLEGLTKLTSLSLAGNPVTDLSPLASLTNLKLLILSGSQAQDYSALANLVNLQVLLLDNSTITDLSPLTALTNLRALYLANTPADDYSPLETSTRTLKRRISSSRPHWWTWDSAWIALTTWRTLTARMPLSPSTMPHGASLQGKTTWISSACPHIWRVITSYRLVIMVFTMPTYVKWIKKANHP
jgi:hypothetical protein